MASKVLAGIALSAVLLTACDYSQKKPETGSLAGAPSAHSSVVGSAVQAPVEAQRAPAAESGVGERSIRLFGRGVSRQRQIRV
jgi:hypothetical protein